MAAVRNLEKWGVLNAIVARRATSSPAVHFWMAMAAGCDLEKWGDLNAIVARWEILKMDPP